MNQEIQSYDHNIGNWVRVRIGMAEMVNGKPEFVVPQQFETYFITDVPERVNPMTNEVISQAITDYTDLMALGNGGITNENLLTIIDRMKART